MFKFSFTLNDDDYFEFAKYDFFNNPVSKKALIVQRLFIPVVCLLVVLGFVLARLELLFIIIELVIMTVISAVWIVSTKSRISKRLRKHINKMKKSGKLPYSEEITYIFNDDSFDSITPKDHSTSKYSVIERIAETEKYICFYVGAGQAHLVPLSAFADDSEKQRFLAFIQSKIAQNAQAQPA